MRWIKAIATAFSAFSRIPAPRVGWDDGALRLSIAFLPLVGIPVGLALWVWHTLCQSLEIGAVLFAAVSVALPVIITGGIHLDGFCDVCDALAANQSKERSLEILKDPHAGAFAVIRLCVYMLLNFGLLHELYLRNCAGIFAVYFISRCFSAACALTLPNARSEGMLAAFTAKTNRLEAGSLLTAQCVLGLAAWIWLTFPAGLSSLVLCAFTTVWYRSVVRRRFGGATGDATGYYQQITELALLLGLLIGDVLTKCI